MHEKRCKPLISLLALLLAAPCLFAQSPAAPPAPAGADNAPAKLDTWASFPKPPSDLPFIPLDHAWPARWARLDEKGIKGVVIDIDDPKVNLLSTRGYIPYTADDSADAAAL